MIKGKATTVLKLWDKIFTEEVMNGMSQKDRDIVLRERKKLNDATKTST